MLPEPLLGDFCSMFGIIIVLENDFAPVQTIILESRCEFVPNDIAIKRSIEPALNFRQVPDSLECHATPDHDGAATKLSCWIELVP